jgi:GNAT superfamily N-acetyltransferase
MHQITYRHGIPADDWAIAEHFYQLWLDNTVLPEAIRPDWQAEILAFITQARQSLAYQSFIAEVEGEIVGSVGCQIFAGLYPIPFQPHYRQDGYIWGVYVAPAYRKQGIGATLTQKSVDYLRAIGCTRAVLNASPFGKSAYERLGFQPHNAMVLDFRDQGSQTEGGNIRDYNGAR